MSSRRKKMYNSQTLAINSIRNHGEENGWCCDTQLIVICDFVSENNLDEKLEQYLQERGKKEKGLSNKEMDKIERNLSKEVKNKIVKYDTSKVRKKMPPGTKVHKDKKKEEKRTLGRKKVNFPDN